MGSKLIIVSIMVLAIGIIFCLYIFYGRYTRQVLSTRDNFPGQNPNTYTKKDEYTWQEVSSHSVFDSCWSIVEGKVYDFTGWTYHHPEDQEKILTICGRDGSWLFDPIHEDHHDHDHISSVQSHLDPYYIGELVPN